MGYQLNTQPYLHNSLAPYSLAEAEKKWRRLNGHALIAKVIEGVKFTNEEMEVAEAA